MPTRTSVHLGARRFVERPSRVRKEVKERYEDKKEGYGCHRGYRFDGCDNSYTFMYAGFPSHSRFRSV